MSKKAQIRLWPENAKALREIVKTDDSKRSLNTLGNVFIKEGIKLSGRRELFTKQEAVTE